ncbi:MAG TPA: hypothetical protein VL240_14300 [Candidatus Binatia bacterium]|nr:hypothetical protein [Candidatus Binatia bacterium]
MGFFVGRYAGNSFHVDSPGLCHLSSRHEIFRAGQASFMIDFRAHNLDQLLKALREEGVPVEDKAEEADYGKFGWITDPEGTRGEL